MAKKTNRTVLTKLIKEMDDMDLAFLRERIYAVASNVIANKEEILKNEDSLFFAPHLYVSAMEKAKKLCELN